MRSAFVHSTAEPKDLGNQHPCCCFADPLLRFLFGGVYWESKPNIPS